MQLFQLLAAALSGGTVLLFGMLGGIFTETSGVMNLAIEGYMLLGATISYSVLHLFLEYLAERHVLGDDVAFTLAVDDQIGRAHV